jgi:hypothetical protein
VQGRVPRDRVCVASRDVPCAASEFHYCTNRTVKSAKYRDPNTPSADHHSTTNRKKHTHSEKNGNISFAYGGGGGSGMYFFVTANRRSFGTITSSSLSTALHCQKGGEGERCSANHKCNGEQISCDENVISSLQRFVHFTHACVHATDELCELHFGEHIDCQQKRRQKHTLHTQHKSNHITLANTHIHAEHKEDKK